MSTPLAAIVLCAGKGTRMKSELPKVLHPLLGRPLCAYPIGRALEVGARKVVAVVGHQASAVETALRVQFPGERVQIALQAEQRGTAHAVECARSAMEGVSGTALILYGDVPLLTTQSLERLCEAHRAAGGVLSIVTTQPSDPTGYGRVVRESGKIARVVEQKDATEKQREIREVNAGIYAVDLAFLWPALERLTPANAQGELYLTDLVAAAAARGPVGSVEIDAEEARGVNDRAQLAECANVLRQRVRERLMREGVTLVDPSTVWIEEDVEIGPDSCIEPMVSIGAGCRLGRNVVVGQGCVLRSARIGDGTRLQPYTVIEEASVAEGCILGPFARLRPGTELSRNVHLGNFVETKKTRIGEGSKANHLSYLGDAEIGSGVNVGAGTITCNYDGKDKHKTVLEDGVFIGSDTQLVAPVRVKKGAYVGAGTTVTRDVPEGSLAVSRSPQVNKEGWVALKKGG